MDHLRGIFIAACIALAGTGGGVWVENLHTGSPRLLMAGIAAAILGTIAGGLALGRALGDSARD